MKHKFYLLLLILPVLISFDLSNQFVLKEDSVSPSNFEASSFSLVNKWQVNGPAFFYPNTESYTLNSKGFGFGHFVEFKEDKTFESYYHASCGNDCFSQTNGTYTIKDDIVEIFVVSAKQTGFCSNPIRFSNKKMGTFKITKKTKDNFLLKRI
ncbi:MAG: hypothetical protein JKY03_15815 [Aureispira sp.]|nr:hypothetical protein [Aureispira sp.]